MAIKLIFYYGDGFRGRGGGDSSSNGNHVGGPSISDKDHDSASSDVISGTGIKWPKIGDG